MYLLVPNAALIETKLLVNGLFTCPLNNDNQRQPVLMGTSKFYHKISNRENMRIPITQSPFLVTPDICRIAYSKSVNRNNLYIYNLLYEDIKMLLSERVSSTATCASLQLTLTRHPSSHS